MAEALGPSPSRGMAVEAQRRRRPTSPISMDLPARLTTAEALSFNTAALNFFFIEESDFFLFRMKNASLNLKSRGERWGSYHLDIFS
jgi:hypothetical protein